MRGGAGARRSTEDAPRPRGCWWNWETASFAALLVLGVGVIWIAPRPAMIDLPQHAGQIALLRDLVLGQSRWAEEVHINLATPYLLGYLLALPLAMVMPVVVAVKVVLTAAFLAFVSACVAIRRELDGSRLLDSYFIMPFFGVAYAWGLYTFLVASGLGLCFIWLCIRYARCGGLRLGAALSGVGLALLLSHGLVFLFSCGIGALLVLVNAPSFWGLARRSFPFWILLAGCLLMFAVVRSREAAFAGGFAQDTVWSPYGRIANIVSNGLDPGALWTVPFFLFLAIFPFLAGLRLDRTPRESVVIFSAVVTVLLVAPDTAWSTAMIYERFPLFLFPAYAWLFQPPAEGTQRPSRLPPLALQLTATTAAVIVLMVHGYEGYLFRVDSRDFEAVLAKAEPRERALSMVFDRGTYPVAYLNHAVWYQADKHGFVDFNFAYFHPQIVRFNSVRNALVHERFAWRPTTDLPPQARTYRYFFVRRSKPIPVINVRGAACPPQKIAGRGKWELFERQPCSAQAERDARVPAP